MLGHKHVRTAEQHIGRQPGGDRPWRQHRREPVGQQGRVDRRADQELERVLVDGRQPREPGRVDARRLDRGLDLVQIEVRGHAQISAALDQLERRLLSRERLL